MAIEQDSPFLRLPTELRLQIYNHAALSGIVTITSAPSGSGAGAHIPGLPFDHLPVVRLGYHRDWLRPVVSTLSIPLNVQGSTGLFAARGSQRISRGPLQVTAQLRNLFGTNAERANYRSAVCSCLRVSCPQNRQGRCQRLEQEHLTGDLSTRYSAPSAEAIPKTDSPSSLSPAAKEPDAETQITEQVGESTREPSHDNIHLTSYPWSLYNAFSSLRLTSHQIHGEISDLSYNSSVAPLDLYVSYPAGVCVLMHCYPHLLRSTRTVRICGTFDLAAVRIPIDYRRPDRDEWKANVENLNDDDYAWDVNEPRRAARLVIKTQVATLEHLVTLLLGLDVTKASRATTNNSPDSADALSTAQPDATRLATRVPALQQLTLRVLYHDTTPCFTSSTLGVYNGIWSAPLSPACMAMQHIYGGEIQMALARGGNATGMEVVAKPSEGGGKIIACHWPRLAATERGMGSCREERGSLGSAAPEDGLGWCVRTENGWGEAGVGEWERGKKQILADADTAT